MFIGIQMLSGEENKMERKNAKHIKLHITHKHKKWRSYSLAELNA